MFKKHLVALKKIHRMILTMPQCPLKTMGNLYTITNSAPRCMGDLGMACLELHSVINETPQDNTLIPTSIQQIHSVRYKVREHTEDEPHMMGSIAMRNDALNTGISQGPGPLCN